jgi:tetratricopeptide (TPR) repeat protein
MAIPIEGYSVVAQKARIVHLLENGSINVPNNTALADDDIWRCSFMEQTDALDFIRSLEKLDLNGSRGPDSDIVLVNEFDCSVNPYCEWLVTARWEKAVIAWRTGTHPEKIVAREGWDPKAGSGLHFADRNSMDNLEFLRLDGNVEVYRNKETGKEVYVGRTSLPLEAMFKTAGRIINQHLVTAGEKPVSGDDAKQVREAVEVLEKVIAAAPNSWNALWLHGKGNLALGRHEIAYQSFRRAYELEKNVEAVPRELAGVCLQLCKFDEAAQVAEQAVALEPKDAGLIGNLALAYLLAGRLEEAKRSISAAIKIDRNDRINSSLLQIIQDVDDGRRPQPTSLASLSSTPPKPAKKFWEFWKR